MAQDTFGTRLAEARRRRGLSLDQVHTQLRISSVILAALEAGDFYHMPLKGHARNMVSSYARYLGLDSEEITAQFLSEYHLFENQESRHSLPRGGSSSVDVFAPNTVRTESSSGYGAQGTQGNYGAQGTQGNYGGYSSRSSSSQRSSSASDDQGVRSMWNKPIPASELNRGYSPRPSSTQRSANPTGRRRTVTREDANPTGVNQYDIGSYRTKPSLPARVSRTLFRSPVVLIVVLILVLVLLLVFWAMVANSCKKQENTIVPITSVPPSGADTLADPNAPLVLGEGQEQTDPSIGPFELVIDPAAGTGPWTEVTVDGEGVYAGLLTETKTWTVTEDCSISTGQPGNLTVTRNGEKVDLEIDNGGLGWLDLEVKKAPVAAGPTS